MKGELWPPLTWCRRVPLVPVMHYVVTCCVLGLLPGPISFIYVRNKYAYIMRIWVQILIRTPCESHYKHIMHISIISNEICRFYDWVAGANLCFLYLYMNVYITIPFIYIRLICFRHCPLTRVSSVILYLYICINKYIYIYIYIDQPKQTAYITTTAIVMSLCPHSASKQHMKGAIVWQKKNSWS